MDAGAVIAGGDVLVFLQADTRLPEDAADHVRAALADESIVGGNFFLRHVPFTRAGLLFTAYALARRSLLHEYGGRSGLSVRRRVFAGSRRLRPRTAPKMRKSRQTLKCPGSRRIRSVGRLR